MRSSFVLRQQLRKNQLSHPLPTSLRQILARPLPPDPLPAPSSTSTSPATFSPTPTSTSVNGWIRAIRKHRNVTFVEVSDGSSAETLQAVWKGKGKEETGKGTTIGEEIDSLTNGTSVSLKGIIQKSKGKGQKPELIIEEMKILGSCPSESYPIHKSSSPPSLRLSHPHLRPQQPPFSSLLRLKNSLRRDWEDYFEREEFVGIQGPIMTGMDCEGGGEGFWIGRGVVRKDESKEMKDGKVEGQSLGPESTLGVSTALTTSSSEIGPTSSSPTPYFPSPTYLTVSSQLHLESPMHALSRVYTFSPCFRAEESQKTSRHLAEFWMWECEVGWLEDEEGGGGGSGSGRALGQVMDTLEAGLRAVIGGLVREEKGGQGQGSTTGQGDSEETDNDRSRRARKDLEVVWESVAKDLEDGNHTSPDHDPHQYIPTTTHLQTLISQPFRRISYTDAILLLEKRHHRTKAFKHPPKWGNALQSEHEKYLAGWECLDSPVFVTDYPKQLKPFYMRVNPRFEGDKGETVSCFDLLIPHIGELAGGSVREERLDHLERAVEARGLDKEAYDWYLDLRRFGSVRHGGWGMGWERFLCWVTGVGNVRDVVGFPRWKGNCKY